MPTPHLSPRVVSDSPARVSLRKGSPAIVGFDVGGTKCAISVVQKGRVEEVRRWPTRSYRETLTAAVDTVRTLSLKGEIVMGISCGGPLDLQAGRILNPPNLPRTWHGASIVKDIRRHLRARAVLMNDANACALAEWRFGAGRGVRHLIFLTAGTGFGAGVIVNGRLLEGATGDAGEIGHVRLSPDGPLGFGKHGSVEGFCSGGGIARTAERAGHPGLSAHAVFLAAKSGENWANEIIDRMASRLGEALAVLIDLFNPERIVLGGIYPRTRAKIAPIMQRTLRREALVRARRACAILPSELGETIGSHGAIAAALHALEEEGLRHAVRTPRQRAGMIGKRNTS